MESPVSRPLVLQRDTAAELVAEIAPSASQSILLTNMEKNGMYRDPAFWKGEIMTMASINFKF